MLSLSAAKGKQGFPEYSTPNPNKGREGERRSVGCFEHALRREAEILSMDHQGHAVYTGKSKCLIWKANEISEAMLGSKT